MNREIRAIPTGDLWNQLWELRTSHVSCKRCIRRTRKKIKGPEGKKKFPIFVCDPKFDAIIEELANRYQTKAYKILRRLLDKLGVRGYDADVLCSHRFFFALLRYHPSFYPENPEGGFFPFLVNPSMLFFDTRDYKKRNVSPINFSPVNDLLQDVESEDLSPDFDID